MSEEATNGASAPVAQTPALKSTDTSNAPKVTAEPAKPAEAKAPEPKAPKTEAPKDTANEQAPPEGETQDDAPAAAAPERKEQRLPRWMKERLERERQVTAARTREQVLREMQAAAPADTQRQAAEPQGEREKTLEDFDFDTAKFIAYQVDRGIERTKREETTRAEQQKQAAAADEFKAKIDTFEARVGAGAWEDIESSTLNTDPKYKPLCDLFLGDEHDLDIAHHLVQHPEEVERLIALSPIARAREVAKLAEQFSDEAPPAVVAQAPTPPKKTTNAPPPPKTVSGAGKPSVDVRDPGISTADRIRAWKKQSGG